MNYTMSRFEVAAVQRQLRKTPEQYIAWCGGPQQARANYNSLIGQAADRELMSNFPFWRQVNAILKKAGV